MLDGDATMERLEEQITWYDRKSVYNQRMFKWLKTVEIAAAALVPLIAVAFYRFDVARDTPP